MGRGTRGLGKENIHGGRGSNTFKEEDESEPDSTVVLKPLEKQINQYICKLAVKGKDAQKNPGRGDARKRTRGRTKQNYRGGKGRLRRDRSLAKKYIRTIRDKGGDKREALRKMPRGEKREGNAPRKPGECSLPTGGKSCKRQVGCEGVAGGGRRP